MAHLQNYPTYHTGQAKLSLIVFDLLRLSKFQNCEMDQHWVLPWFNLHLLILWTSSNYSETYDFNLTLNLALNLIYHAPLPLFLTYVKWPPLRNNRRIVKHWAHATPFSCVLCHNCFIKATFLSCVFVTGRFRQAHAEPPSPRSYNPPPHPISFTRNTEAR